MQALTPDEKEQTELYGKLLADFANARTTDEACFGLLENIAEICQKLGIRFRGGFSSFTRGFPSLNGLKSSLSKPEKVLMMSLVIESKRKSFLGDHLITHYGKGLFEDYDSQKQTLTCTERHHYGKWVDGEWVGDVQVVPHEIHISEIRDEDWLSMKPGTKTEVEKLFKIGRIINTYKESIPESRFSEIKRFSEHYSALLSGRQHIEPVRNKLKRALSYYVRKWDPSCSSSVMTDLNALGSCRYFETEYNNRFSAVGNKISLPTLFHDNVNIIKLDFGTEVPSCHAPFFLNAVSPFSRNFPYPNWYDAYKDAIVFCLVRYLMTPRNSKLIRKCHKCQKLYITERAYTSKSGRYFCRDCSHKDNRTREQKNQAQRVYRKRKKETKKRQSYEERTEYLIEKGIDRKQAKEIAYTDIYGEDLS